MMRKKEIMHELDKAIEVIVNDKIVWDGPMADFIVENQYDIEESDINLDKSTIQKMLQDVYREACELV